MKRAPEDADRIRQNCKPPKMRKATRAKILADARWKNNRALLPPMSRPELCLYRRLRKYGADRQEALLEVLGL